MSGHGCFPKAILIPDSLLCHYCLDRVLKLYLPQVEFHVQPVRPLGGLGTLGAAGPAIWRPPVQNISDATSISRAVGFGPRQQPGSSLGGLSTRWSCRTNQFYKTRVMGRLPTSRAISQSPSQNVEGLVRLDSLGITSRSDSCHRKRQSRELFLEILYVISFSCGFFLWILITLDGLRKCVD
jgi:hypothetical protein